MTADEVREALGQKLKDRWSEYSAEMLRRPPAEIFERANEIAAARFCCDQLTESSISYPVEYLEYLLRFEDPLSVVRDQWASDQNVDCSDEFEHALWMIQNDSTAEQDYPLDPEWKPEQTGPSMC
ncbi:DUF3848 domain-containing protein [Oscillibacter sp. CU971]|jgi:hypothetical protein|uniref:DUF3848 domain-containing protein n=1 Tax=Oscillibacter sp. CU971 TaxID=2780102 RepID=UPI00195EBA2F|nr:DUF3848 domain-containing protein [Oscillibacter sp. CU971]